jgi:hypothetical protein
MNALLGKNDRFFRQGLTFLLNWCVTSIRYFHHSEKKLNFSNS